MVNNINTSLLTLNKPYWSDLRAAFLDLEINILRVFPSLVSLIINILTAIVPVLHLTVYVFHNLFDLHVSVTKQNVLMVYIFSSQVLQQGPFS